MNLSFVMPALVAGIHVFCCESSKSKTWMAGTSPAMTMEGVGEKVRGRTRGPPVEYRNKRGPCAAPLLCYRPEGMGLWRALRPAPTRAKKSRGKWVRSA